MKDDRQPPFDVHISYKYIRYTETANAVLLDREPGLHEPAIIWVPSRERWTAEMPAWARDRRDEIIERIKRTAPREDEWREY